MSESELKLFIWEDVLTDWTAGMAFAIAHTFEEALDLINTYEEMSISEMLPRDKCTEHSLSEPIARTIWGGG